jgi:hypothetical protein
LKKKKEKKKKRKRDREEEDDVKDFSHLKDEIAFGEQAEAPPRFSVVPKQKPNVLSLSSHCLFTCVCEHLREKLYGCSIAVSLPHRRHQTSNLRDL